jgi:hypothetical protein
MSPIADGAYTLRMELAEGKDNSVPESGAYAISLAAGAAVTDRDFGVVDVNPTWQNLANPLDVDANGTVIPRDALLLINEINTPFYRDQVTGLLPVPPSSLPDVQARAYFFDVNGDGFLTASDAIEIINFLNSRPPAAAVVAFVDVSSPPAISDDARAAVLMELTQRDEYGQSSRRPLADVDDEVVILLAADRRALLV